MHVEDMPNVGWQTTTTLSVHVRLDILETRTNIVKLHVSLRHLIYNRILLFDISSTKDFKMKTRK